MKVLHIMAGSVETGAGRGAMTLHKALQQLHVDSRLLGRFPRNLPEDFAGTRISSLQRVAVGVRNRLYLKTLHRNPSAPAVMFHPISHGHSPERHADHDWADIVHVQWSQAAMFGRSFWSGLKRRTKPVLFTLRDQWLFTGGCHFGGGCTGYERDCTPCPILRAPNQTVTARDLAYKAGTLADADCFVAISNRIAAEARRSTVLRDADIRLIPNAVDTCKFSPIDLRTARRQLGLPESGFVAATGALYLSDPRKGGAIMPRVMAALGSEPGLHWAVFGGDPYPLPDNATYFGRIDDDEKLNLLYAAADVFVMPSLQESFGKMTAEALAAGTPVVAFSGTPADEIIQPGVSGLLACHGSVDALAAQILLMKSLGTSPRQAMGMAGRRDVLARYSPQTVAAAHLRLYEELLDRRR